MSTHNYLVCVSNEKYSVSLEPKKLYEVLPDPQAETRGMVRVIDESGEGYLLPGESLYAGGFAGKYHQGFGKTCRMIKGRVAKKQHIFARI